MRLTDIYSHATHISQALDRTTLADPKMIRLFMRGEFTPETVAEAFRQFAGGVKHNSEHIRDECQAEMKKQAERQRAYRDRIL